METAINPLIYLASPYSAYYEGRHKAFVKVCWKAAQLMEQGYLVFAPIAHSHPIEDYGMSEEKSGDWWLEQDAAILQHCDELWVYQMPGWETSYGVQWEINYAKEKNIPIKYITD